MDEIAPFGGFAPRTHVALSCLVTASGAAASGHPDAAFGNGGAVVMHVDAGQPFGFDWSMDTLVDHAGRPLSVGYSADEEYDDDNPDPSLLVGLIVRRLPDGSPDPTFNAIGHVHLTWQEHGVLLFRVREQADGKLLVGGRSMPNGTPVVCRLEESGALDSQFGAGGCQTLDSTNGLPGLVVLSDMEILADGGIVVLGARTIFDQFYPRDPVLLRMLPNGDIDLAFGDPDACPDPAPRCGIAFVPEMLSHATEPVALAVDPNTARLVIAGQINEEPTFNTFVAFRYLPNGDLDLAFNALAFSGLTGHPGGGHYVRDIQILPEDSSVLVSGYVYGKVPDIYVAIGKLRADGAVDTTFGQQGRAIYASGYGGTASLQDDGKLVVLGSTNDSLCQAMRIDARTGVLDKAFGANGIATLPPFSADMKDCSASQVIADKNFVLVSGTTYGELYDQNPFLFRLEKDNLFRDSFDH